MLGEWEIARGKNSAAAIIAAKETLRSRTFSTPTVAVEKLHFPQKSENLGDRKGLGKSRKSFVGHRSAKFFRAFSRARVFQQPRLFSTVIGKHQGARQDFFPAIAVSSIPPWLASGWGCRDRHPCYGSGGTLACQRDVKIREFHGDVRGHEPTHH